MEEPTPLLKQEHQQQQQQQHGESEQHETRSVSSPATSIMTTCEDDERERNSRRAEIARNYRNRKKFEIAKVEATIKSLESENKSLHEKISKTENVLYIMKFEIFNAHLNNIMRVETERRLMEAQLLSRMEHRLDHSADHRLGHRYPLCQY